MRDPDHELPRQPRPAAASSPKRGRTSRRVKLNRLVRGNFGVDHGQPRRGKSHFGSTKPYAEHLHEVVAAAEDQRALAHQQIERHADAVADILKPGRPGEALGRMHARRKALPTRGDPRPNLGRLLDLLLELLSRRSARARSARSGMVFRRSAGMPARGASRRDIHARFQNFAGIDAVSSCGSRSPKRARIASLQRRPVTLAQQRDENRREWDRKCARAAYVDVVIGDRCQSKRQKASVTAPDGNPRPSVTLDLPIGRKVDHWVPRRINVRAFGRGTVSICATSGSSTDEASMSFRRSAATGRNLASWSAPATQVL